MLKKNIFLALTASCFYAVPLGVAGEIEAEFKAKLLTMPPDSEISALIFIQDKVDLASLVAQLDAINADRTTRNRTVITTLMDKANLTQGPFLAYLAMQKGLSEVKTYQEFWIDNVISVQGKVRVLLAAENIPNVSIPYTIKEPPVVNLRVSKPGNIASTRTLPSTIATTAAESNLKHINAHRVWEMGLHGEGRLVCIFDTGTDLHVAFANRWRGNQPGVMASAAWFDPFNQTTQPIDADSAPGTGRWHGTHVTGIAVGMSNPDTIGVAWGAQWIAAYVVRVGVPDLIDFADQIISAYQWAINPDGNPNTLNDVPDVINNSWGTDLYGCDDTFWGSIDAVEAAGIVNIIAVANSGPGQVKSPESRILNEYVNFGVGNINTTIQPFQINNSSGRGPSPCAGTGNVTIKPEVVAPGVNIRSARRTSDYAVLTGTSFATPHVSGTVALMRQADPNLSVNQIKQILFDTGKDYGSQGNDNDYGYGMIDAYQAVLMAYAYQNKSVSATATAQNNGRRLVKDSSGKYHLVFESGITSGGNVLSEIFYRNSTDGVNWSAAVRLSAGNEQNRYPCIAERSGKLYVVWQRKTGTNTYDNLFRHFNGTSWETIRNVTTGISGDLPVIATSTPSSGFEMMVAYRTGSGLKSKRTTSMIGSTWETEKTITTNTSGRNPSLVYKQGAGFLVTWDNLNTVYYQAYNGSSWGTATNVSGPAGSSSSYSTESSIALAGNLDRHIAWKAEDPQLGDYVEVVFHNKNLNPTVFTEFADLYGYQYIRPSITGHNSAVASLTWQKKSGYTPIDVRKARYNGSSWDTNPEGTVIASGGFYPSVSVQNPPGGTAHAVWMTGSGAPYAINFGPQGGLSKSAETEPVAYHRRIIYQLPSGKSVLSVSMSEVQFKNTAGDKAVLNFPIVSDNDTVAVADLKNTVTLHNINLPTNVDSLLFDVRLYSREADSLRSDLKSSLKLRFELAESSNGSPVLVGSTMTFPDTGKYRQHLRIGMAVRAFANRNLTLRPVIENLKDKDLQGAVVHVYAFGGSDAKKPFVSSSNTVIEPALNLRIYPNPFNPSTKIRLTHPVAGAISLRIYDVNGRLVRELLHAQHAAGEHIVTWDGRDERGVAAVSGVYFIRFEAGREVKVGKVMLVQ